MFSAEARSLLALNLIPGVGSTQVQRLLAFFGSGQEVLAASRSQLAQVAGLPPAVVDALVARTDSRPVDEELQRIEERGCSLLTLSESGYPERLAQIPDPPPVLYIRGELKARDQQAIAVVGTRTPSRYGRAVAEQLTRELVARGFTIVSGLARGIDGVAHRTALQEGGRTIAVLGSGLSRIYPEEHVRLAEQIAEQGAILSEFPMEAPPLGGHFPQRNRVISGLSIGVLIAEAGEKSGSLITARLALEQGREVFAVPGDIRLHGSVGPHRLIRDGAVLVTGIEDILEALPEYARQASAGNTPRPAPEPVELNPDEQKIWGALGTTEVHIDTLVQRTGMPIARISSILVMMEIKGLVQQLPGKLFARKFHRSL